MEFLLQVTNGLQIGSIYALVSLGYTMVYGVAKLINFAHGDIIMIGAYICLYLIPVLSAIGLPIWVGVFVAIIVCAILGVLIERIAYRPLRNSPRISNLITAIGVSLLLENLAMMFFGAASKPFPPVFPATRIGLAGLEVSISTILTIVITLILAIALQIFMRKSKLGRGILATSEDEGAAQLVGIDINKSIGLTFAIGSGLAAVGSLFYLSAYAQVQPLMGSMLGIKAFIAAVLGGIGSIPGAVIGGFLLGIVEVFTRVYLDSQLADAFVFGILILVLVLKPTGILGKNTIEKV